MRHWRSTHHPRRASALPQAAEQALVVGISRARGRCEASRGMHWTVIMASSLPSFLATDPDVYEHFMGRWSARLAEPFLDFAGVQSGDRVLDVGCGTGTISLALAKRGATTVGVDASEPYLDGARRLRPHPNVTYEHGDACHLQYSSALFDACVSTLAIDVIPGVDLVAAEMRRVTRSGGVVACGTFDFWGGNSVVDLVLDTGAVLDEGIRTLRAQIKARPIVWANGQANLWRRAGLVEVVEVPIVLSFDYTGFEDYWSSFSTGPTRIAQRLTALPSGLRSEIEQHVRAGYLAGHRTGPTSATR
jgi:2-polyprenyl-3-methyl-5-hydroxy-6-metoxy-1,4-benzoquinol methylase